MYIKLYKSIEANFENDLEHPYSIYLLSQASRSISSKCWRKKYHLVIVQQISKMTCILGRFLHSGMALQHGSALIYKF